MAFKDYFSRQAADYAGFRPTYPAELFAYLASLCPGRNLAWDCGTGNGQAASGLADHFQKVIATDPSEKQLASAVPHPRVVYQVAAAEKTAISSASVDLVTVAQALHWFDLDQFYAEARRVLKPSGVLAAWCYNLPRVAPEIDPLIEKFYAQTVGPYWPPERRLVEDAYRSLPFPFAEIAAPAFSMTAQWDLPNLVGYLSTWSAVQEFIRLRKSNPLDLLLKDLRPAWGDPAGKKPLAWPFSLRVGKNLRVESNA